MLVHPVLEWPPLYVSIQDYGFVVVNINTHGNETDLLYSTCMVICHLHHHWSPLIMYLNVDNLCLCVPNNMNKDMKRSLVVVINVSLQYCLLSPGSSALTTQTMNSWLNHA